MGRLETLRTLYRGERPTLNLGAKRTGEGDVRIDVDPAGRPDAVGSALAVPVRSGAVAQVLFTDVIEHLPGGTEPVALREIARVLRPGGRLVLSTPNHRPLYTYSDPAYWTEGHRHYREADLVRLVEESGLVVERSGTFGGLRDWAALLWMYGFYPVKRLRGDYPPVAHALGRAAPDPLREDGKGYTRFVVARKP